MPEDMQWLVNPREDVERALEDEAGLGSRMLTDIARQWGRSDGDGRASAGVVLIVNACVIWSPSRHSSWSCSISDGQNRDRRGWRLS